ncbi:MAG: cytochrome c oxidase subunit 3 [Acidimicrobiia bacterium]|jgi:cytochrome c oxidase subunit 3|nr:cytochrome c oxidase subunit 3 [Acidimicrobiia bacterium]
MTAHVLPPAPAVQRPRVLVVGAAFAAAASFTVFIGLIGIYLAARVDVVGSGAAWLPEGATIPLQQPNTMFITLIMSVFTMQWAVAAIAKNDRVNSYLAMGLTLMLGIATIVMTTYLWYLMELDIASGIQGVLIYTITGAHIVMLVLAMLFVALMGLRALGGQFTARQHDGITAAAVFWYAMVAVYALIWISIYVTK